MVSLLYRVWSSLMEEMLKLFLHSIFLWLFPNKYTSILLLNLFHICHCYSSYVGSVGRKARAPFEAPTKLAIYVRFPSCVTTSPRGSDTGPYWNAFHSQTSIRPSSCMIHPHLMPVLDLKHFLHLPFMRGIKQASSCNEFQI